MEEKWLKKLHTAGRLKELRVQGITKRWVINILGVIALFFVIVFVVSAFTIRAYYYNAVESILNSGASTTATNYFSGRLDGGSSLEASAADFIDSFSYRDKTTIWIINNAGGVVTSSSGFAVEKVRMPDYEEALAGDTGRARYVGHITDNGEKCMAVTRIIYSDSVHRSDQIGAAFMGRIGCGHNQQLVQAAERRFRTIERVQQMQVAVMDRINRPAVNATAHFICHNTWVGHTWRRDFFLLSPAAAGACL